MIRDINFYAIREEDFKHWSPIGKFTAVNGIHSVIIEDLIRGAKDEKVINYLQGVLSGMKLAHELILKADGQ